jgi:hypothetical protein
MRIDFYTRAVLTVIALCLVWIAIGGRSLLPAVEAQQTQQGTTRVVIVGYERGNLPLPVQIEGNR